MENTVTCLMVVISEFYFCSPWHTCAYVSLCLLSPKVVYFIYLFIWVGFKSSIQTAGLGEEREFLKMGIVMALAFQRTSSWLSRDNSILQQFAAEARGYRQKNVFSLACFLPFLCSCSSETEQISGFVLTVRSTCPVLPFFCFISTPEASEIFPVPVHYPPPPPPNPLSSLSCLGVNIFYCQPLNMTKLIVNIFDK